MEAQGIRMNWCLKEDDVPTRDTTVPPAPEELSNHRKRQVRFPFHVFLVVIYVQDAFQNLKLLVICVS